MNPLKTRSRQLQLASRWRPVAGRLEAPPTVPVMTTSRTFSVAAAICALALASAVVSMFDAASQAEAATRVQTTAPAVAAPSAYGWPVKPFNRQHPVRGFFGDPRISNHGRSRQFHFGIDISAPNGTPVYATLSGTISIHALHSTMVLIAGANGVEFSYWHVVPTVRSGQRAVAYKTLIGYIEEPYGHVHFSESSNRRYLNPLRPGALGPYSDNTRPRVTSVRAGSTDVRCNRPRARRVRPRRDGARRDADGRSPPLA